ncbi:YqzG/YhdC family protein [Metabacillus sp. FJAT-52054]|uniref:YqzG/YhdC family protein n=1 Tax=Metabacillus sediminis TaxID=3117746 RepID=A0ABZ2NJ15_9BACI
MKKWISCFLIAGILAGIAEPRLVYSAHQQEPAYAKWSRIAIQEVKRKYPDAKLLDYKHIGREKVDAELAAEKFKLWVRQGSREFGLFVTVEFNEKTQKVKSIHFKESER